MWDSEPWNRSKFDESLKFRRRLFNDFKRTNFPDTPSMCARSPTREAFWSTSMEYEGESSIPVTTRKYMINHFGVAFERLGGCNLGLGGIEWPFDDVWGYMRKDHKPFEPIKCSSTKDFKEIRDYIKEICPNGKNAHLRHHWMLCAIRPTLDIEPYINVCNYFAHFDKVGEAVIKSEEHGDFLIYVCPPDKKVVPAKYLKDAFGCERQRDCYGV